MLMRDSLPPCFGQESASFLEQHHRIATDFRVSPEVCRILVCQSQ